MARSAADARGRRPGRVPAGRHPGIAWWPVGTGPVTVVLEAGLGASSAGWSAVVDELARDVRVVCHDRPGLGGNPHTRCCAAGLSGLADHLLTVVAAVRRDGPVVLVGHSWGASVVRLAGYRRPDLVAGMVLIEPVPEDWLLRWGGLVAPAGTPLYLALQTAAALGLVRLLARGDPARRWLAGRAGALPEPTRAALVAEACRLSHHISGWREFIGMSLRSRPELAELAAAPAADVPVLVVSGGGRPGREEALRARLVAAHEALARSCGARHVVLPGGHPLPREHPSGVARAVTAVCRQVGTSASAAGPLVPRRRAG